MWAFSYPWNEYENLSTCAVAPSVNRRANPHRNMLFDNESQVEPFRGFPSSGESGDARPLGAGIRLGQTPGFPGSRFADRARRVHPLPAQTMKRTASKIDGGDVTKKGQALRPRGPGSERGCRRTLRRVVVRRVIVQRNA